MIKKAKMIRTTNIIQIDDIEFVNAKHLSDLHKVGVTTVQKQLASVNELWEFDAIKIGHNVFYNRKEAELVVSTFKRDYESIRQDCLNKLVSTFEKPKK
jgi:hydroxymethylpyrimidine/phosphomethylpyrimidine kinase